MKTPTEVTEEHEWSRIFEQAGDGNSGVKQQLCVRQEHCGGGPFFVIETERWSFDSIEEIVAVLQRAGVSADLSALGKMGEE